MACSSMTPYHFAFQPQPLAESPFSVRQSKISYTPGNDTVVVALTSVKGRTFKGFLIKVNFGDKFSERRKHDKLCARPRIHRVAVI